MQQFTLKIKKPIRGIKEELISPPKGQPSQSSERESPVIKEYKFQGREDTIQSLKNRLHMLEEALQKAREESFALGYEEGKKKGLLLAQEKIDQLSEELKTIEDRYHAALEKMEEPLLELAQKMAERILGQELQHLDDYKTVVMNQLRQMLPEVIEQNRVIIKVNPEHLKDLTVAELSREFNLPDSMEVSLMADQRLKPGEVFIRTEDYFVDGTYQSQLNHLTKGLLNGEGE